MSTRYYVVNIHPDEYGEANSCHNVVNIGPWSRHNFTIGGVSVIGRCAWGASNPKWSNEVVYYNTAEHSLETILNRFVVHHSDNSVSIGANERRQRRNNYAALGYHFFIDKDGDVYEGRPIEIMGSNAGEGEISGPLNDPDWGAVGIVLQGDYHHADDGLFGGRTAPQVQLDRLEELMSALSEIYGIHRLLMHREVVGTDCPGDHLAPIIESMRDRLEFSS